MIAPQVLLGRPRVARSEHAATRTAPGGRAARAILLVLFASAVALESATSDPRMDLGTYLYRGIGSWTGLPIIFSPLELLLAIGLAAALASNAAARRSVMDRRFGAAAILSLLVALAAGLVRGVLDGGDPYVGFWEIRALLYVPVCYAVARMVLRSRRHVTMFMRSGLTAAALFAIEGAYRRIALVDTGRLGVPQEFAYQHEDAIFLAIFILFIFAAQVFGAFGRLRLAAVIMLPLMLFTLLATERRAGMIVLMVGLLVIALVVLFVRVRMFLLSALPVVAGAALYLALFWGASGILGQPARAIQSLYEPDPRDAASNLYRVIETYDVSQNIQANPLLGVGFGKPFDMVIRLPDLSWWPFWHFETHNSVLWIWLKTGAIGYVIVWSLLGGAIVRAAFAAKRLADPELRATALFCLVSIVATVVYAYVDLGFVSERLMVLLGTVLGVLAVVESLDRPAESGKEETWTPGSPRPSRRATA